MSSKDGTRLGRRRLRNVDWKATAPKKNRAAMEDGDESFHVVIVSHESFDVSFIFFETS